MNTLAADTHTTTSPTLLRPWGPPTRSAVLAGSKPDVSPGRGMEAYGTLLSSVLRLGGRFTLSCMMMAACGTVSPPGRVSGEPATATAEFVALIPQILHAAQQHGPRGAPLLVDVGSLQLAARDYGTEPIPREQIDHAIGQEYRDVSYDAAVLRLGERRIETVDRGLHIRVGGVLRTQGSADLLVMTTYSLAEEHHSTLGQALLHLSFINRDSAWILLSVTRLRVT